MTSVDRAALDRIVAELDALIVLLDGPPRTTRPSCARLFARLRYRLRRRARRHPS